MKIFLPILLLFLALPSAEAQELYGSFGSSSRFFIKCTPHEGEIQTTYSEIAWKGERISKQILLWTELDTIKNLAFEISDLSSGSDAIFSEHSKLRSVKFTRSDAESLACGEYKIRDSVSFLELGDILSMSLDSTLYPGCPSMYWLSIDIPAESEPGTYSGQIKVRTSEEIIKTFDLHIQVVDHLLPGSEDWNFHLDLWQFPTSVVDRFNQSNPAKSMEYWSANHFSILKKEYCMLADMGQKVITTHIKEGALGSPSMIKWIRSSNGHWEYDYSIFDKYVDSLSSWGISKQISCQSPVGWNSDVLPFWNESLNSWSELNAPVGSDTYTKNWNHFLTDFKLHLDEKGWFKRTVLYLDEVGSDKLEAVIQLIKNNHPGWKIGMAGFHPPSDFVNSNIYDLSLMVGTEDTSMRTVSNMPSTFYSSCNPPRPNNFVVGDAHLAENIWIGWHAHKMNYNGYLRWAFDYWNKDDPIEQRVGSHTSGDFSLCYRSSNNLDMEICSSVRLELIREGIEDYEKIIVIKNNLKNSKSAEDQHSYKLLLNKIEEFTASSGQSEEIETLVNSARELLNEISCGMTF